MIRHISILLIASLGFFFMPGATALACGDMDDPMEMSCCDDSDENMDCCEDTNGNDSCNGDCEHASCFCPSVNTTITAHSVAVKKHDFHNKEKQNFSFDKTFISSGFNAIWVPPKIS